VGRGDLRGIGKRGASDKTASSLQREKCGSGKVLKSWPPFQRKGFVVFGCKTGKKPFKRKGEVFGEKTGFLLQGRCSPKGGLSQKPLDLETREKRTSSVAREAREKSRMKETRENLKRGRRRNKKKIILEREKGPPRS